MNTKTHHKTAGSFRNSTATAAMAAALLLVANPATAGDFTWDGGGADGNWSTPENWVGDVAPVDGTFHNYIFDGTLQTTTSADITATAGGLNVQDVTFNAGAGAFTIGGPRIFDLLGVTGGGAAQNTDICLVINNSTATQTFTTELIHRSDFNTGLVLNAAAGDIVVSSTISQAGTQPDPVTIVGPGTVSFSGANTYTAPTLVGGGLLDDDFNSYTVNAAVDNDPGSEWNQAGTGTVRVEEETAGGNRYLAFGWEGGDPSAGNSRSATRPFDPIGVGNTATVTFRVRVENDLANSEWYYGISDTPPTFNGGFGGMNYHVSIGLVADATADDGVLDLVAGVAGGGSTTTLGSLNTNTWYNIALIIDDTAQTFDVYVDDVKQNVSPLAYQGTPAGALDQFSVTGGGAGDLTNRWDAHLDDLVAAEAGNLVFDGTHAGAMPADPDAGSYTVNAGSTLSGTGSITLAGGETLGANRLGVVAPGDRSGSTTGTLTVTGDVALGDGSLAVRIDGANDVTDTLAITGNLDVMGSTLDLSGVISPPDDASYTLVTYTGTITGPVFATVVGLPAGYSISYATAGEVQLVSGVDTTPPMLIATVPADNATEVAPGVNLEATFDELVTPTIAGGNITLHRTSDNSVVETFDVTTSPRITIVGATVTIDPTNLLVGGTGYYVLIDANTFEDAAGNPYGGISDTTAWSFTVDSIAPALVSLSPADNDTGVLFDADLTITLDEAIAAGIGNITLHRTSDNSVVETFDVMSSTQLTFSATDVTIDPTASLVGGTEYYVLIAGTAITDLAGNAYAGISDTTAWSFTVESTPPAIVTLSPVDDATKVFTSFKFTAVFDEAVQVAPTGNIEIRLAADNSVVESFDVTTDVTVSGTSVSFRPSTPLALNTAYYVNIDSGAIEDLAANDYGGIGDTATWSFTTSDTAPIVAEIFDGTGAGLDGVTADVFNSNITAAGGSSTWVAGSQYLDDGTVTVAGGSQLAYLDLGTYIEDTKGTATGKFELTVTFTETISEWLSFGFSQLNAPALTSNFVSQSGVATLIRRETDDWDLDMFPENGVAVRIEGPEPTDPGPRTITVRLDFTPAGGYDGTTNFGTVSWTDSALGVLSGPRSTDSMVVSSHTYTSAFTFASILLSESNNSGGMVSALTLTQIGGPPPAIYDTWAASFGLTGGDAATTADTDIPTPDGLEQLLEFAFGTNPNDSDKVALTVTNGTTFTPGTPVVEEIFDGGNPVVLRFVRRTDHVAAGLTYTPEFTDSVGGFYEDPDAPTPTVVSDAGGAYQVVEVPFPLFDSLGEKACALIARVRVTLN